MGPSNLACFNFSLSDFLNRFKRNNATKIYSCIPNKLRKKSSLQCQLINTIPVYDFVYHFGKEAKLVLADISKNIVKCSATHVICLGRRLCGEK
jgi:hypothetical protein